MFLPRELISLLYLQLVRTRHAQSPSVLVLVALEPDALCACRILTSLFKRDYIAHTIIPVSGYGDLARVGEKQIQPMRVPHGGSGGTVVCLGVGGLVDLSALLGLESTDHDPDGTGGVEIWVVDARRPYNLGNVFGGKPPGPALGHMPSHQWEAERPASTIPSEVGPAYTPGRGGIIVYDDGDIATNLHAEGEAYQQLERMPPIEDDGEESDESEAESADDAGHIDGSAKKRKYWEESETEDPSDSEASRARRRRVERSDDSSPPRPFRPGPRTLLSTTAATTNGGHRSASSSPSQIPPSHQTGPDDTRRNRRRLLRIKRTCEGILHGYYSHGASYSEPISSLVYALAGELGRENNDSLWHAIVGVSSPELYGQSHGGVGLSNGQSAGSSYGWGGVSGDKIRQVLRDEVRRLNPPDLNDTRAEIARGEASGVIPTTARSSDDTSIQLSPEPRLLLVRHWALYDSMLHSPYLASRLHLWSDAGRNRLAKLLAVMGISLSESKQQYTHMNLELKRGLRQRLLKYAPAYGLAGLVPPVPGTPRGREGWGFVRSWGWKACLSAVDVGVILGAILEVGKNGIRSAEGSNLSRNERLEPVDEDGHNESEAYVTRFWDAYDALENVEILTESLEITKTLHRAILRTGTDLLSKHQIRHLSAFRMAIVREGPYFQLFTHPGALTKLALWVAEAIVQQERKKGEKASKKGTPLVLAALNEARGVYVVVGTGGGGGVVDVAGRRDREERRKEKARLKEEKAAEKARLRAEKKATHDADHQPNGDDTEEEDGAEDDDDDDDDDSDDSDDDDENNNNNNDGGGGTNGHARRGYGLNRFGNAFQEVVEETSARVRIDSFESCVVEVQKDHLSRFLESLSMKAVVG